jgi:hypothetical protein
MANPIEKEAEIKELKHEKSFTIPLKDETNEEISASIEDPDIMRTMILLLLICLTLALLADAVI